MDSRRSFLKLFAGASASAAIIPALPPRATELSPVTTPTNPTRLAPLSNMSNMGELMPGYFTVPQNPIRVGLARAYGPKF
jgi:hypothetical protein